jgi:DNA (cytosine-5)-methyltransferase 1
MNNKKISWNLTELDAIKKNNLKVMTTFSCGGGSSMGYKLAGCDVIAANDIDPVMQKHYITNLHPEYYFLCPIKDLITKDLPNELFQLDILDGSPPCSTFSMAGLREKAWGKEKKFREGQAKQVLDDLFFDFLKLAERLNPKVIIAENVKGMMVGQAKGYLKLILEKLNKMGYSTQIFLINGVTCGVPQARERIFICSVRNDLKKPKLDLKINELQINVEEAISDLIVNKKELMIKSDGKMFRMWEHTAEGQSFSKACAKENGKNSLFNFVKIARNKPCCTLAAVENVFHYNEPRRLSFSEWKRLGSFPDDYIAESEKIGKYMVGMSVPPKMTYEISKNIIEQWLM